MAESIWTLSLLLSDGRNTCSRSAASGSDPDQLLRGLASTLRPPLPTGRRPVWIRLDARAPDRLPERGPHLRDALQRSLLTALGISRAPQLRVDAGGEQLLLWLDLSVCPASSRSPLMQAQERARAWLLRHRERHGRIEQEPALQLATLLLVRSDTDRPDLEMAIHGLSRVVREQGRQPISSRNAARALAVLSAQLGQEPQPQNDLTTTCRDLQRSVIHALAARSTAATATALFGLAMAQAAGIAEPGSERPLQDLLTQLQERPRAAATARCAALLSLMVLAEAGSLQPALNLEQIQAIADLDDPGQVRDDSTALRAVLLLRLGQILGWSPADAAAWHGAAAAVVLRRQCTPITAIAAADPQEVLGGFGDCRCGPAPLARQLAPLLTLHHLLQLPGDHASA